MDRHGYRWDVVDQDGLIPDGQHVDYFVYRVTRQPR